MMFSGCGRVIPLTPKARPFAGSGPGWLVFFTVREKQLDIANGCVSQRQVQHQRFDMRATLPSQLPYLRRRLLRHKRLALCCKRFVQLQGG